VIIVKLVHGTIQQILLTLPTATMPDHHPGTFLANNNVNPTDVPWALTTHLLSVNHEQLLRTI
jgi:hypothetical protein